MANLKQIYKNFTLFVDGNLFSGDVETVKLPDLKWKTEDYRGGGMDIPVEIKLGHEKIEFEFDVTCHSDTLYMQYGIAPGVQKLFKFYGVLIDFNGTETGVTIEVEGFIKSLDAGNVKNGDKTTSKMTVAVNYIKHTIGSNVVLEIDAMNLKFVVNGTDILANTRQLLGV